MKSAPPAQRTNRRPLARGVCAWAGGVAVAAMLGSSVHAQAMPMSDHPRAATLFAQAGGYADLTPDRYGTPASPVLTELGMLLAMRMFRNVCLGLERGETLKDVAPEGFRLYHSSPYYFGPDMPKRGETIVLSSTGDVELDEAGGHPALAVTPRGGAVTCTLEWQMKNPPEEERQIAMSSVLARWMPFSFALVHADRPDMRDTLAPHHFAEWDRPCGDKWCGLIVNAAFNRGHVMLQTRLNVTEIKGTRP